MEILKTILATSVVMLFTFGAAYADTPRGIIVMAKLLDDVASLDPAETYEATGIEVNANVYDRLVRFDPTRGKLLPALSDKWTVSGDSLKYTFHIRQGVKFESGNPLTADDAVYSLRRVIALNKTPAFILKQFGFTADNFNETIKAVDIETIQITVSKPVAPTFMLNCFASTPAAIVDSKVVGSHEANGDWGNGWLKTASAGTGAYRLRTYTPNEQVVLDANPGWFEGAPKNKRVIIRHIPEAASQRLLLEKGDVDVARNLTKDQLAAVSADKDIKVIVGDKGYIMYLGLNQKNPILAKPQVREALKWLVDYQSIERNIVAGTYRQHEAFLPTGFLGSIDDSPYHFDLAKAKALLKEAGLENGFTVTMDVRSASPWTDIAQAIQSDFAQAGVKLELIPGDYRQILTKYRARTHDIYLGYWSPDYNDPHTNAEGFASNPNNADNTQSTKTLAWRNDWDIPEMTKETEAALVESDPVKRNADYEMLQREHQKVSPFVVMFQQVEAVAERKTIDGYVVGFGGPDTNFYASISKN